MIIKADTLYTGKEVKENAYIEIDEQYIKDVTFEKKDHNIEGIVTPAFIDAHSHIGMERQGEPSEEGEANDEIDQITPLNNPLNSIYMDDRAFKDTVDFGVLYSCIVPGSGNLLGGKAVIIRNFAPNRKTALLKNYGYKMALGYNPRSTTSWKGTRPTTRMGTYALLEEAFDEVLLKRKKEKYQLEDNLQEIEEKYSHKKINKAEKDERLKHTRDEYELEFTKQDLALLDILEGDSVCKVHVHKEDDVLYLLELVEKYGIRITVDHACDVHHQDIFDLCALKHIPVVYGPVGSQDYKVELKHAYYQNTRLLIDSQVEFGLMTDHPVILSHHLRDSLKYFLIQGMSETDAISLITYRNARILGIDDILGTVEKGKLASLIVWNKDPLHLGAMPKAVIAEGKLIRGDLVIH